jgi:hypothetical protein
MTPFHNVVRNYDIIPSHAYIAFNLPTTLTTADIGKAVTLDATAPNKVKLAGAQDPILGRLETVEVRSASQVVGSVSVSGIMKLPIGAGATIVVGDTAVGSGAATGGVTQRLVTATPTPDPTDNLVIEVIGTTHVVVLKK